MEQVKELLQSRIEKIHDPVQRILLQDVLVDVFMELLHYSDKQFENLEKRLDAEIQGSSGSVSYTHLTLPTKLEV